MSEPKWVKASELSHLVVPMRYHLWQAIDGQNKSLTNTPALKLLESERWLGFDTECFWELMASIYPHPTLKNVPVNGFYFVDHILKVNNVAMGDVWNEQIEAYLVHRGVVVYRASVSDSDLKPHPGIMKLLARR